MPDNILNIGTAGSTIPPSPAPGPFMLRGAWDSSVAYVPNDVVTYNNALYGAKVGNSNVTPVDGATWSLMLQVIFGVTITGTPSSGQVLMATDSTDATWQWPLPSTQTAPSHKFATAMDHSGNLTFTQPAFSDISGTATSGQYIVMVGDSGSGGVQGAVPAPPSGSAAANKFLKADGTWAVPGASGVTSFNSRTGAVVPATNDYSFSQISGSVAASQLPNPSATTLGGTESFAAVTHQFLTSISTSGVPAAAQPAFTDLSGVAVAGQIPSLDAAKITTGQIALARGGTNADLSATGGTSQVLMQTTVGGNVTVAQLAFTDISGAAAAAQYVTMVGDSGSGGTKGAVPAPAAGDAAANKFLKANGTWAVPSGSGGGITNSAATSIVPVTVDSSGDLGTSLIWSGGSEVRIGSTTNILANTSRLYVFGGASGCNVDVQADGSTAGSDVAQVEVEGSDYATHVNSIAIRYFGPTAIGTFCGITAQSVGVLDFIGSTTTAGIIRTGGNFPLVLGTNDVERLRINATGESKFSSSLAITGAVNVSQVAAPAAPTIAPHGGSASTWAYKIVAYDNNNQPTTASASGQTTTGAATLDSTHWNQVNWSEVAGASYYKVFRVTVATSPTTTGVIGTVNSGNAMTLRDNGLAGDSSSVPTANTTGEVTATALVLNGPLIQPLSTKTASYSLTVNDRIILVNSAGATTMTLPVTGATGQMWTIKNINTGTCTVQGASGNIEGNASATLNPSNSFDVVFDGTNFWIV
jgi:hypothetical protein